MQTSRTYCLLKYHEPSWGAQCLLTIAQKWVNPDECFTWYTISVEFGFKLFMRHCIESFLKIWYKYVCLFVVVDISGPIVNYWAEPCFAAVVFTVSLTCTLCKLAEHIVCSNIMSHLEEHNVITDKQHAFRKYHSCETQLCSVIHDWARNIFIMLHFIGWNLIPHFCAQEPSLSISFCNILQSSVESITL
jgi:hypothetical protein